MPVLMATLPSTTAAKPKGGSDFVAAKEIELLSACSATHGSSDPVRQ